MRQLIIDIEGYSSKEEKVLQMLKAMGIPYRTSEHQTIQEYNQEIDEAIKDFNRGSFITADELKKQSKQW